MDDLFSLKDEPSFLRNLIGLPTSFHFSNYLSAIKTGKMDVAFVNSVLVSVTAVAALVFIAFVSRSGICKVQFRGKTICIPCSFPGC